MSFDNNYVFNKEKDDKKHFECMLEFLGKNKIVLQGKTKPCEAKKNTHLWQEFALEANFIDEGPLGN